MQIQLEKQTSNDYIQLTSKRERNNRTDNSDNFLFEICKPQFSNSYITSKLIKNKNNIFPLYKNNIINKNILKTKLLSNENISPVINSFSLKRQSSQMTNINNSSMNQSFFSNSFNLINFFKNNQKNKNHLLPNINSKENIIQNETSFIIKNNKNKNIDKNININSGMNSPKIGYSPKNIKKYNAYENKITSYKSSRKYLKMKTLLNLKKQFKLLDNETKLKKDKKENDEENGIKKKEKQMQNHKLFLYSKKSNKDIFKIYKYKNTEHKLNNIDKNGFEYFNNINKSSKLYNEDCLDNFDPKKYIKMLKHKIKCGNIGNSKIPKNKLLYKACNYIEYSIMKNKIFIKNKENTLEIIKEKNKNLIFKIKKELLQKKINEILLKANIKYKNIIYKFHIDILLMVKSIQFYNYINLNFIKNNITKSEQEENLYSINYKNHLINSGKRQNSIWNSFNKESPLNRIKKIEKFLISNDQKINYLYFCFTFQLQDSETILKPYNEKKIKTTKYFKSINKSSIEGDKVDSIQQEKSMDNSSTMEKIIKITQIKKISKKRKTSNKYNISQNLMNINLTQNIINLRNINIKEILKKLSIKNIKKNNFIKNIRKYNDICNNYEYKKNNKKLINTILKDNNNNIINSGRSIKDDNGEVHKRDKKILFEHFFSFVKFSQYKKLFNWFKEDGKYIDLNYKLDNGDTLLHLCVKHSVPDYIIQYVIYRGVNIDDQNNDGDTALHIAVKNHKYKTIDFLIKMGASEYIYNKMNKCCWECF